MIADRQTREKSIPKRRKKEKILKAITIDDSNNEYDDEDVDEDKDDDDSDFVDNVNNVKEAITETNEAVTVNISRIESNLQQKKKDRAKYTHIFHYVHSVKRSLQINWQPN